MAYTPPTYDSIIRKEIERQIQTAIPGEKIFVSSVEHRRYATKVAKKLRPSDRFDIRVLDLGKDNSLWSRW